MKPLSLRAASLAIALAAGLLAGTSATAATTPTGDFTDNGDGTVTHGPTQLTWKRCAEGQAWTGTTCAGSASTATWTQAMAITQSFAGAGDWRLPTIAELLTLLERDSFSPTINPAMFPATPGTFFWSATGYKAAASHAWAVYFGSAVSGAYDKGLSYSVRLVRGTPFTNAAGLYTPASDFADNGNGTVTHLRTGLSWKRCSEGQTWTGTSCSGAPASVTWAQAGAAQTFAGSGDWRLPTQSELLTLVEWSTFGPAINGAVFPGTPGVSPAFYWSSTQPVGDASQAWMVFFDDGNVNARQVANTAFARLVRGSSGPPSTLSDCLFNWAERNYASMFAPPTQAAVRWAPYYYRYYPQTATYLATAGNGRVYYLRAGSSEGIVDVGPLTAWLARAGCQ